MAAVKNGRWVRISVGAPLGFDGFARNQIRNWLLECVSAGYVPKQREIDAARERQKSCELTGTSYFVGTIIPNEIIRYAASVTRTEKPVRDWLIAAINKGFLESKF